MEQGNKSGPLSQDLLTGRWFEPPSAEYIANWTQRNAARDFVAESNRIEGIHFPPTDAEIDEHLRFIALPKITLDELTRFLSVYQPDAELRIHAGLNVRVGSHRPPSGGANILVALHRILDAVNEGELTPYLIHCEYESLHPFTDGNGRSGRVLWAWQMHQRGGCPLGFLHHFYYQALDVNRVEK